MARTTTDTYTRATEDGTMREIPIRPDGLAAEHGSWCDDQTSFPPPPRCEACTAATALHYHYGSNIPGYLPMADEPNIAETWEGARDALADDLERAGDMADVDDYAPGWGASWAQALEDVRTAAEGEDIYVNVCSDGAHDLGVSYWVTACVEAECLEWLENNR